MHLTMEKIGGINTMHASKQSQGTPNINQIFCVTERIKEKAIRFSHPYHLPIKHSVLKPEGNPSLARTKLTKYLNKC